MPANAAPLGAPAIDYLPRPVVVPTTTGTTLKMRLGGTARQQLRADEAGAAESSVRQTPECP